MALTYDEIVFSVADGVIDIVLNRPDQLNPISGRPGGTRDQILGALAEAEADESIGCAILRGAGRAFSGGGDLTGNARREAAVEDALFIEAAESFNRRLRASRIPVVAAVHGYCLGAAMNLAANCDFIVAATNAKFGLPEGRMGLIGATALVPIVGRQWAKFLMLTGEHIDASTAEEIGLVLTVVPDDELVHRTTDLARRISRMPQEGVLLNRRAIDAVADAYGEAAARAAAVGHDAVTLANSARATAPDGRTFRQILDTEGMAGMKKAREAQYTEPWLRR